MILTIDTHTISETFFLDQSQVDDLLDFTVKEVTAGFAREWENQANRELGSSRQQYMNSIVVVDGGRARGAVMLVGEFPNMLESGASSFDMKEGIINGPNSKQGKNGRYNTVPFKHGVPTSLSENFNGGILPQEVYNIIKVKELDKPLTKDELPKQFQEPQKKQVKMPESKSFAEYQHKNSVYEALTKKQDKTTGQNSYVTFRRVSENSANESWIHPGLEARNLADKALESFQPDQIVSRAIDAWLDANLG